MGKREFLLNGKTKRMFCFTILSMFIVSSMMGFTACGKETPEEFVSKDLKLFYVSQNFVETGDESKGVLVEYDDVTIHIPEGVPDGMTEEEAASYGYTSAVSQLWSVPEELDNADTVVTERIGVNNIICKDGTAYVDLVSVDLQGKGGSMEEAVFISQITETLIKSFDEIKQVQFIVDGEPAETLMGHCDTTEPFSGSLYQ